jgi:RimJ/RimL family protein N-acetyltransferase
VRHHHARYNGDKEEVCDILHELGKQEFRRVVPLAKVVNHNRVVVDAVIQGNYDARVFVDSSENPRNALLYPRGVFSYLLLSARHNQFLQDVQQLLFEELKVEGIELLAYPELSGEELQILLDGRPHINLIRRDYRLNEEKFAVLDGKLRLTPSSEFELRKIDKALLDDFPVELMPRQTDEEFLRHSFGYALLRGQELVSQCVVAFRSTTAAELSVKTSENYRRQGMAVPVCAAVIDKIIQDGLNPTWSCWDFNEASWKLGQKLGFELDNTKQLYLWDQWIQEKYERDRVAPE